MEDVRKCEASHCSAADSELHKICKKYPPNTPVLTRDSKGPCECVCSCLALGTPVLVSSQDWRAIETIKVNDAIYAAGRDLKFKETKVQFSHGTDESGVQPNSVFILFEAAPVADADAKDVLISIVVTSDHLFLLPDGKLKRAERLNIDDKLVRPDGSAARIVHVNTGDFHGGFHHVATTLGAPDEDLSGHLIVTAGVVSGDYTLQLHARDEDKAKLLPFSQIEDQPIVGSRAYATKYPAVMAGFDMESTPKPQNFLVRDRAVPNKSTFVPASSTRVTIPADAEAFFAKEEEDALTGTVPSGPFNDPNARGWTDYLLRHYAIFYPEVTFLLDWYSEAVNAYAWIQAGRRHVLILGGLVRANVMGLEGVALVTAHELGHHYGGAPTYPGSPLSCEGQADFIGARDIMRHVWFGSEYIEVMEPAIQQLSHLFGFLPTALTKKRFIAGCSHPPTACRVTTYNAAIDLRRIPACAT